MLPDYYDKLHAAIYSSEGVIGSGLYCGAGRLITCAHVVNVAIGRGDAVTDPPPLGTRIQLRFPESLLVNRSRYFTATLLKWCPAPGSMLSYENDLALLALDADPELDQLENASRKLEFIADDVEEDEHAFECKRWRPGDVYGTTIKGDIINASQLDPRASRTVFISEGSSGSPVYSGARQGIWGIVCQRGKLNNGEYASMVLAGTIATFTGFIELKKTGRELKQRWRREKIKKHRKFFCDRLPVINGIKMQSRQSGKNFFFILGNEFQEGEYFRVRYQCESFDIKDHTNSCVPIIIHMPDVFDPGTFKHQLLARFSDAINVRTEEKPEGEDIKGATAVLGKVPQLFLFKIDRFSTPQKDCYTWFIQDFLKLNDKDFPAHLHIIVLFTYKEVNRASVDEAKKLLTEVFSQSALHLENVKRVEIVAWLDMIAEDDNIAFIEDLKEKFSEEEYGMMQVIRAFEDVEKKHSRV